MKRELIFIFLFFTSTLVYSQKAIFLHHSTGNGVFYEGGVASWITDYNSNHGTNYQVDERNFPNTPYPWQNYPYDYWNLWINNGCDNTDPDIECMDKLAQDYEVIIFKHCFPGARILSDDGNPSISSQVKTLANYKLQYRALRSLMDSYPERKFIVWTLAPLHRLSTSSENAARAREFVDWVQTSWLTEDGGSHPNIYLFDFFAYAAEGNSEPSNGQTNCLRYEYEKSHEDSDSHPNLLANQTIGPLFAQFIVNTIEDSEDPLIQVATITVSSVGGVTDLLTGETLQFTAEVLPTNADNKDITWSVINQTGTGAINQEGVFTGTSKGTVKVIATAQDGSGITGTKIIQINEIGTNFETLDSDEICIYPNPSQGKFFIQNQDDEIIQIVVTSLSGIGVLNKVIKEGTSQISLDIGAVKAGIYLLDVYKTEGSFRKKIVIVP